MRRNKMEPRLERRLSAGITCRRPLAGGDVRGLLPCFTLILLLLVTSDSNAAEQLKLPSYNKVLLENGMTVLLMEQKEVPVVSFSFILRAGSTSDPEGKEGLASLTAGLLRKGTKLRTADQISNQLDFIGGEFDATATYDYTNGEAEFLKKDIDKGLELVSDVLLHPVFPEKEVTKLISQRLDETKAAKDQPDEVIGLYFSSYLYKKHPYGRPAHGDEKSLAAIRHQDVLQFYQNQYHPSNFILAVVGDFSSAEMEKKIRLLFEKWPAKKNASIEFPEPSAAKGKSLLLVDKPDATQTFYTFGNVGIAATNPDRVYVDVVNTFFGARFTSMLNSELRISSGLTYGAWSFFIRRKTKGPFRIYSFTQNETTEKALDLTLDLLKRLHQTGLTEKQLQSAKSYIKGQFPLDIETTDQLADTITQLEFYGLDASEINDLYAKIDAMSIADASRIIQEYFPMENLVFVLIGKASDVREVAKKYATTLDQKSISDPGF